MKKNQQILLAGAAALAATHGHTLANCGLYLPEDRGPNANPIGEICFANEARFTTANFSEPLTTYRTGWAGQDAQIKALEELLEFLAPAVNVGRRFEFKAGVNAQALLSETDDIRAIGSPFKRVEYTGTSTNSKTLNKGLTIRLDRDDMQEGDEEQAARNLTARLLRSECRRAGVILLAIDNTGTNKTWGSSANPDEDVQNSIDSAGDDSGLDPNRVLYGKAAWRLRSSSHSAQATAGAFKGVGTTPDELAKMLGVEAVRVATERYQSSASAKSKIIGAYVVSFYAQSNISKDDPSCVKRFVTPVGGGMRVFREEHDKYVDISVEHYSNVVATATVGAKKLNIS